MNGGPTPGGGAIAGKPTRLLEIAEVLGKSEDSCKMMFSRTIAKLKKEMPVAVFVLLMLMNL